MKKIIVAALAVLTTASVALATPASVGFRNYSAAGITNYATTCSVLESSVATDGSVDVASVTSYSMTKGGTASFTAKAGKDYKISCFQTTSPKDAITVKMFFNASETYYFPISSIVLRKQ